MAQTAKAKLAEVSIRDTSTVKNINNLVDIRVSLNSYFMTFFLAGFLTGFLFYLGYDLYAWLFLLICWVLIPLLAWYDRIVFDGNHIFRTGILPNIWTAVNGKPRRLKIKQIEQIETQALRALKRGGNVYYRYRTSVNGKGLRLVFASGGEGYRQMVSQIFSKVSDDVLDNRSLELRDYLKDSKETLMKAEFARIPSMEVLENSINEFQNPDNSLRTKWAKKLANIQEGEKSDYLRQLANELRMSGNLLQALETFRRALLLNPHNPWLIFEFARCLHSYASLERSSRLIKKANAALRLAELKAEKDADLLARIGEAYFQYGNWKRAQKTFYKTLSLTEKSFRSVRGLAEVALREGKIAHVIHHFGSATHFAENNSLKRWAAGENEYFSKLNNDETYMEAEMTRISWLDSVEKKKRIMQRLSFLSLLIVLFGVLVNETIANVGWTASFISILLWVGLVLSQSLLSERCPIIESED